MKTSKFIFDTNTVISAFLIGGSTSSQAFRSALDIGEIITTHTIKRELADVFLRRKFDKYATLANRIQILSLIESQFVEWVELLRGLHYAEIPKTISSWNWWRQVMRPALLLGMKIF